MRDINLRNTYGVYLKKKDKTLICTPFKLCLCCVCQGCVVYHNHVMEYSHASIEIQNNEAIKSLMTNTQGLRKFNGHIQSV